MKKRLLMTFIFLLSMVVACQPAILVPSDPSATPMAVIQPTNTHQPKPTVTLVTAPPVITSTVTNVEENEALTNGIIAFYSNRDGNLEIYTMDSNGNNLQRLTDDPAFDDSPAISPDGTQIVFLTARHDPDSHFPNLKYEIYMMDANGDHPNRLTFTEASEDHPDWSPDSSKILFDADYDADGFAEIYTMNSDGTDLKRLTANKANDQFADWSPDGSQIAFSSDRYGNWDIFIMDVDGSNQHALSDNPDWELFPAWSPDGHQIAYNGLVPNSRNTDVFVMDADGSQGRQLTDAPGFDENPDWSLDGNQIAFQTRRSGNFEIYTMNADGSDQHPMYENSADDLWPSWGVAFSSPQTSMATIEFEKSTQDLGMRETFQVGLGDLDGDGDLDAVFANPMKNDAEVWLNDGEGYFEITGQQLTRYGHGVELADFDGDGDLDAFIVCHQFISPSKIYLNDGNGLFSDSGQDLGDAQLSAADLSLVDINGDGYIDVQVMYYAPNGLPDKVYLNDGKAIFSDSGLSLDEDTIAWGDLNNDGDIDYFGKYWTVGYVVMLNDGNGHFTTGWDMQDQQSTIGDIALADFDNDGDLDALVANGSRGTSGVSGLLLWNDGNGTFSDSGQRFNETSGAELSVGDLDLDGDLDVFVANMDLPNEIWLNEAGLMIDSGLRLGDAADMSGKASLGDLDGDGDLDVIVGRFKGGAEIWINTGALDQ